MKKMNKKSILLLIAVAALALTTVGGTLAYLMTKTDPVVNTFEPAKLHTIIDEDVTNNVKTSIQVQNTSDSINAYVRVAIVGNWYEGTNIVDSWELDEEKYLALGVNYAADTTNKIAAGTWNKLNGYYYYSGILKPGESTGNLLKANLPVSEGLVIDVIHQSVQADGIGANSATGAFDNADN